MENHFIIWWNLENLLHHKDYSKRPEWLSKNLKNNLKGWTEKMLNQKISNQTGFLKTLNEGKGPDILGVCEVENHDVLELFAENLGEDLDGRKYEVILYEMDDKRGIDLGIVYDANKYSPKFDEDGQPKIFNYRLTKRTPTRDILHVELVTKSGTHFVLLLNHWNARIPGTYETQPYRIIAAETLSYWIQRIHEELGNDIPIMVMGDFNDEPHDRSLVDYALSSEVKQRVINARNHRLYNLMWQVAGRRRGTYIYGGESLILDQFLVSKAMIKRNSPFQVLEDSINIEGHGVLTKGSYHTPIPFRKSKSSFNPEGFSDHLPISIRVDEKV